MPATSDALVEQVASSLQGLIYGPSLRALPPWTDEVTRDFGPDQYDRMRDSDPQVASTLKVLLMSALQQPLTLGPPVAPKDDRYDYALQLADFCQRALDRLEHPLADWMYEVGEEALVVGHKVSEKVYKVETLRDEDGPQLILRDLKPKAHNTTAFIMDRFNNELGLVYVGPSRSNPFGLYNLSAAAPFIIPVVNSQGSSPGSGSSPSAGAGSKTNGTGSDSPPEDVQEIPGLIPRSKFAVCTFMGRNSDPRGSSALRQAFVWWNLKMKLLPAYEAYLATYAQPPATAILPENAQNLTIPSDTPGKPIKLAKAIGDALATLHSGGYATFPFGTTLDLLQVTGDGRTFLYAVDLCDRQIVKSILLQTLATEEGIHQSGKATETHADILSLPVRFIKHMLCQTLRRDVLLPLVTLNYGEAARAYVPIPSLGDVNLADMPALWNAAAALGRSGMTHVSQYAGLDAMLGLPPRNMEWQISDMQMERSLMLGNPLAARNIAQAMQSSVDRVAAREQAIRVTDQLQDLPGLPQDVQELATADPSVLQKGAGGGGGGAGGGGA